VLDDMSQPIYEALDNARKRVMDELAEKPYKGELSSRFQSLFAELKDKADQCNNVATFQNIKVEADALKMRLLNELAKKDAELAAAQKPPAKYPTAADKPENTSAVAEPSQPKVKSVSIKTVNVGGTWQIKNRADVDARLEELRQRLYNVIEDGTVLNIEF
jgi:regulator of replication initiation timing